MQLRWTPLAECDLLHIEDYIARDNPTAAQRIVLTIIKRAEALITFPGMGRTGRQPETRELVLSDHPFFLVYRVKNECVEILRVLHQAQQWPSSGKD